MASRAEEDRLDLDSLPSLDREWARLAAYRLANEEKKAAVEAALAVPKDKRTPLQHRIIGYSTFGIANKHNF